MPIEVRWYIPNAIILIDMIGVVTEYEFSEMFYPQGNDLVDQAEGKLVVVCTDYMTQAPPMRVLLNPRSTPNTPWIIFASRTTTPVGRFLASTCVIFLGIKCRFVRSIHEVNRELERIEPKLKAVALPSRYDGHPVLARYEEPAPV